MKKSKIFISFLIAFQVITAVLFNSVTGAFIFSLIGLPAIAGAVMLNALMIGAMLYKIANPQTGNTIAGSFLAGLAREAYSAQLMQQYRPIGEWLARARDLTSYVANMFDNDFLNMSDAGADPAIIEDYDHVDPLPIANDEDSPIIIPLKSFSTERTKITETQQDARAYNIMADRTMRHANTQSMNILKYSSYAFAPSTDSDFTPIVRTSGGAAGGFLKAKLDDVIALDTEMRNLDVQGARIFVLNPTHLGQLQSEDKDLFKGFVPSDPNKSFKLFGFDCYVSTATPRYATDGAPVIKNWKAANENTDLIASFAFVEGEVGRAQGSLKLYKNLDDSATQASFISTRNRFIAVKMRNKYVAALVAKAQ